MKNILLKVEFSMKFLNRPAVDPQELAGNLRRRKPPAAEFESTLAEVLIDTETITMKVILNSVVIVTNN